MSEEIITLEQVFREEREEVSNMIQKLLAKQEELDFDEVEYYNNKKEIFKLQMVVEYLTDRLTGKIK